MSKISVEKGSRGPWKTRLFAAAALAASLLLPVYIEMRSAGAFLVIEPPIDTLEKSSVAVNEIEDIKKGAEKANVLILLDVGSPMIFTPNGTMPEWGVNTSDRKTVNDMLSQATYGHGGLPVKGAGDTNPFPRTRYGRDLDSNNNMTSGNSNLLDHLNNYYSPFNYPNNPASEKFGRGAEPAPYALVFRDPKYWSKGKTGAITSGDLVPNDSRMYKMKLVMWRILSDTTLLENLRLGMATTFQEMCAHERTFSADFYRSGPLDNFNTYTWITSNKGKNLDSYWEEPGYGASNTNFPNGNGPFWSTGIPDKNDDTIYDAENTYYQAASAFMSIDRKYYGYNHDTAEWKLMNRAWLRVPIEEYSDEHISKFRMWLDGLEDVTPKTGPAEAGDSFYYANPELFADGKTYLSTAIYPGHKDLNRNMLVGETKDKMGKGGVVFSSRANHTIMSMKSKFELSDAQNGNFVGNFFRRDSGEALGTVLDLFSPPREGYGGMSYSAVNLLKAPASNFPLNNPCEKNWLIVFTAGDDSGDYSSADAVRDLYDYTKNHPLTRRTGIDRSNNNNTLGEIRLDDGIRTLVVGFVDPVDPASAALRDKLNAMAQAGDPGCAPKDAAGNYAFFANDVEGLIAAMRGVLARINSEIQPDEGSMLEDDKFEDDSVEGGYNSGEEVLFNFYSRSYRINIYDQWEGRVSRHVIVKDNKTGKQRAEELKWEAGERLIARRDSAAEGTASRNLVFWAGGRDTNYEALEYTHIKSANRASAHPGITSYNLNITPPIASMDATILATNTDWNQRMHPSRALINWYYGYEVNYGHFSGVDTQYPRRYMMADLGSSGLAKGGPPTAQDSLPGYRVYANRPENKALPHKLYFHTNDGLLHVLDAKSGREDMAILPPPSLLPYRLFGLKATKDEQTQRYRWINVDGFLTKTSDDMPITSIPSFTLDGAVQRFYMDMSGRGENDGSGWGALLVATLGHAGGGIYSMDVSNPSTPAFRWYRETYEDSDGTLRFYRLDRSSASPEPVETKVAMDDASWNNVYLNGNMYPFYQLGFNSPKPSFGPAKHETGHEYPNGYYNVIALAGGMQNYLDVSKNGAMGAALYLIDPDVTYHRDMTALPSPGLLVFNSGSVADAPGAWRPEGSEAGVNIPNPYMGMMVTEPVFFSTRGSGYVARGVFTADNRGNMFYVSFVDQAGRPLRREDWKIRAIATLRKPGDSVKDNYTRSYALPLGVALGSRLNRGEEWVAGGTSNVGTKGKTVNNDTMIRNEDQSIFCFKMPELWYSASPNYGISKRGQWTSIDADDPDDVMALDARGWYIPLKTANASYDAEYVTTRPEMINGKLYIATFQEEKFAYNGNAPCDTGQKNGLARLYTLSVDTGRAATWDRGKYLDFKGIKITGFTRSEKGKKETLRVHYARLNGSNASASISDVTSKEDNISEAGPNTLEITELSGNGGEYGDWADLASNDQVVNYWRYITE